MTTFPLHALAEESGPAFGSSVEIGNLRKFMVGVRVTAGSGTVNPFRVWLEGTMDGTNFFEIPLVRALKAGIAAPGAATTDERDIVNEAAVVTSEEYVAVYEANVSTVRARWDLQGTVPRETFEVKLRG